MPNHDMSDTACRERAETAQRLDELGGAIEIIADVCEELMARQSQTIKAMEQLQEMVNINQQMIQEIRKCSKQE